MQGRLYRVRLMKYTNVRTVTYHIIKNNVHLRTVFPHKKQEKFNIELISCHCCLCRDVCVKCHAVWNTSLCTPLLVYVICRKAVLYINCCNSKRINFLPPSITPYLYFKIIYIYIYIYRRGGRKHIGGNHYINNGH